MTKLLEEGDVISLNENHKVYAKVPKHFVYSNCKGDFSMAETDVTLDGNFDYLQGDYVVTRTEMTGGGTGHGMHDVYPNGHKVTCHKVADKDTVVSFYQTGCFTAMITDIEPVGKAKLVWEVS